LRCRRHADACSQSFAELLAALQEAFFRHPQPRAAAAVAEALGELAAGTHALQEQARAALVQLTGRLRDEWGAAFRRWGQDAGRGSQQQQRRSRGGAAAGGDEATDAAREACVVRAWAVTLHTADGAAALGKAAELADLLQLHADHGALPPAVRPVFSRCSCGSGSRGADGGGCGRGRVGGGAARVRGGGARGRRRCARARRCAAPRGSAQQARADAARAVHKRRRGRAPHGACPAAAPVLRADRGTPLFQALVQCAALLRTAALAPLDDAAGTALELAAAVSAELRALEEGTPDPALLPFAQCS
jgi:hypothetical protein